MPAPSDPIKYQLWLEKLSLAHKEKAPWNKGIKMPLEFRLKMGKLSKEFWADPNNKAKILERNFKISESKKGDKNPMKRLEVRLKASLKMKGRLMGNANPSKRTEKKLKNSKKLLGYNFSIESRKKISSTLTGKMAGASNPFFGKSHTPENKEKSRRRAINMIASGLLSNRRTQIELKIKAELERRSLHFQEQVPLENITVVDFYLPDNRIVIYCDGDYWHKGEWAKKYNIPRKDKWQTKVLENRGYKVYRFSEAAILDSPASCVNSIPL